MLDFASHLRLNQILALLLQALLTFVPFQGKHQFLQGADTDMGDTHTHFPLGKTGSLSSSGTLRAMSFKNESSETVML